VRHDTDIPATIQRYGASHGIIPCERFRPAVLKLQTIKKLG